MRQALSGAIVNREFKIACRVNFPTVNSGSNALQKGVADSEKLEWIMHVTSMAPRTPPHSIATKMLYCLIIDEVPRDLLKAFILL